METNIIERNLRQFHGTEEYHKHLFPGKSPLLLTDGCKYIRDDLQAFWLFDAIINYQTHKSLKDVNFQIWELKQLKKDFTWLLTCREDTGKRPLISQSLEFSDFPVGYIRIWVIDKVALLPSEY